MNARAASEKRRETVLAKRDGGLLTGVRVKNEKTTPGLLCECVTLPERNVNSGQATKNKSQKEIEKLASPCEQLVATVVVVKIGTKLQCEKK